MTRFGKLVLIGVLAGTLGLIGCSDGDGGGGSAGTGGSAGGGGAGGGGEIAVCGEGESIDDTYTTGTGSVTCDGLGVITVPIELVLAAKADAVDGETDVDVRVSLNLSESTVAELGGLVQQAVIGEASADVDEAGGSNPTNVAATVPCTVDFTPGDAIEVVTPDVTATWTEVDGSIVLEIVDITFAIAQPVPLTLTTGKDHWHVLLRARAIEQQCYVLAAAQTGHHYGKRWSYGHALIADPWGTVLAECGEGEGVAVAEIDPAYVATVRRAVPSLLHRQLG